MTNWNLFSYLNRAMTVLLVCAMTLSSCGGSSDEESEQPVPAPSQQTAQIYAEPTNVLLMYNGFAFYLDYGADTQYFYWKSYTQDAYSKKTEDQLRDEVLKGEQRTVDHEKSYAVINCKESTQYVVVTLSYGRNNEEGELVVTPLSTKSSVDQPQAVLDETLTYNRSYYEWTATKNNYCSTYYTYAAAGPSKFYALSELDRGADIFIALAMKNEITKDGQRHSTDINNVGNWSFKGRDMMYAAQVESGTSTLEASTSDKYLMVVTWGTSISGELSGTFYWAYWSDLFSKSRTFTPKKAMEKREHSETPEELEFDTRNLKLVDLNRREAM